MASFAILNASLFHIRCWLISSDLMMLPYAILFPVILSLYFSLLEKLPNYTIRPNFLSILFHILVIFFSIAIDNTSHSYYVHIKPILSLYRDSIAFFTSTSLWLKCYLGMADSQGIFLCVYPLFHIVFLIG